MSNFEIIPVSSTDFHQNFDRIYEYFRSLKNKGLIFNGKKVILRHEHLILGRESEFWHLVSLGLGETFKVLPCTRCESKRICPTNCDTEAFKVDLKGGLGERKLCTYRAHRINFIEAILSLCNTGDPRVMQFKKKIKNKRSNKWETREFIRFVDDEFDIDYIIILRFNSKSDNYILVAAYPVFYVDSAKQFDKDYVKFKKSPF